MSDEALKDQVAVVTGGASGIGLALGRALAAAGAKVVLVDLDGEAAAAAAGVLGGIGLCLDVTDGDAVAAAIGRIETEVGPVGVYCSNAGIAVGSGLGADGDWSRSWSVHAMAHVHAARAVLPGMAERGAGHFLVTASAAGLLMMMQSAPYTVTKHASVALAEWLAVEYAPRGVMLHCLAPQGVRTPMVAAGDASGTAELEAAGALLEPDEVAAAVMGAFSSGEFLVTPHPEVRGYEAAKVADRDRWLRSMSRLKGRLRG